MLLRLPNAIPTLVRRRDEFTNTFKLGKILIGPTHRTRLAEFHRNEILVPRLALTPIYTLSCESIYHGGSSPCSDETR